MVILTYLILMWSGPLRRWFMMFTLSAFLCAGLGQHVPTVAAAPMSSMAGVSPAMDMGNSDSVPMPCKSNLPKCFSSIGCIFLVALPPAHAQAVTRLAWSRIVYASVTAYRAGMTLEPDLGPPIHV